LIINEELEDNMHGFSGDIKNFIRNGDYESALILIDDYKKFINKLKSCQRRKNKK
jgi:hypothetical protein